MKKMNVFDMYEWDDLVEQTYKKPYCVQQQFGCLDRGHLKLVVPNPEEVEFVESEALDWADENLNANDTCGVKFPVWLARDPSTPIKNKGDLHWKDIDFVTELWWHRVFFPRPETVAQDLYERGILEAGEYLILIDW
jgi:hypothetical protein